MVKKTMRDISVGIFVLIGVVLAFIVVFTIGSEQHLFESQYTLYANFKDVGGLREGAPVRLAGVDVGIVSRVWFLEDIEARLIGTELKINDDVQDRIRGDSVASIQTMGLLGDKFISISMGDPSEPTLKNGDFIATSESISLYGYFERADKIVNNIVSITESLDTFFAPLKREKSGEELARILDTTDDLVREIKDGKGALHALIYGGGDETGGAMGDFSDSINRLNNIVKKIDEGEGTLGALVNDPTLYEDMKIVLGGAKRSKVLRAVIDYTIKKSEKEIEDDE